MLPRQRQELAVRTVEQVIAELPAEIRQAAAGVACHYPARPGDEIAAEFGPDLLGLFSGEAFGEIGETLFPAVPQIHLFLGNLWEEAGADPERFEEEVRITFLHELGHYLGWDEDDMIERGID